MKRLHMLSWCAVLLVSCSKSEPQTEAAQGGKPTVYSVNYPLKYFAERIGGDLVDVVFPAMRGDPAYWEPTPEQVAVFQDADLILLNGAYYAKWVDKVSLPLSKMLDTSAAFKEQYIEIDHAATHSHGPGGEHAHGDVAFTTWLDPRLAAQQAAAIMGAFSRKWPDQEDRFERGFAALEKDLAALDEELSSITSGKGGVPLVMSHPVYQYLERRYGLNAKSVHWEPDAIPDDERVEDLKEMLEDHPAKWMVWEGEPTPESMQRLNDLGVESVIFEPCGNLPEAGDYLTVMAENLGNLRAVFPAR